MSDSQRVTQGSTELVHALHANDRVDAMSTFTVPVVLGGGKKLFAEGVVSRSCADSRSGTLSRRSCVVVQQPTETLTATNATDTTLRRRTLNQFIAQPLMIPLPMIMGDKLG